MVHCSLKLLSVDEMSIIKWKSDDVGLNVLGCRADILGTMWRSLKFSTNDPDDV